jgi:hypothetical protein
MERRRMSRIRRGTQGCRGELSYTKRQPASKWMLEIATFVIRTETELV